jgi:excisionase family DNA binding protein
MTEPDLTPREVADRLGVTVRTVQRWIANGTLPATRVGARVRVAPRALAAVRAGSAGSPAGTAGSTAARPIRRLLIANRGEIAVRIARTARAMGVEPLGVHVAGERPPRGIAVASLIGSYLDGEDLLRAARDTGADAVHPGYGFLAENAGFAAAVSAAGLTWVGPPPQAIDAMGDKAAARRHAAALGVPVVPGYDGDAQDDATLAREAARIGYPVLVKPSAGGGGKGMRVVAEASALPDALAGARREAARAFGDERLILERHLTRPRHVEIQVMFDGHGSGVHLGERDCSAQRRNQKIVEEAPAPAVDRALRARMGEAALRIGSAVGYVGAGTVEMLLADDGEFFFLEMNTRLQVEHPVTEAVVGRDLVRDQLLVASGETLDALGLAESPPIRGHAVEARIYAEDPDAGFLPATGRLVRVAWPSGVRVDTGVEQGDVVSDRFDPMLAKIVAHGGSRSEALDGLRSALAATTLLGVRTNVRYLRWLLEQPPMRDGDMRTDTIDRELTSAARGAEPTEEHWTAAALALAPSGSDPWSGAWRLNRASSVRVRCGEIDRTVRIDPQAAHANDLPAAEVDGLTAHVDVEGQSIEFALAPAPTVDDAVRRARSEDGRGSSVLTAPMPGRVVAIRAAVGVTVEAGAPVIVVEAMKMEHAVVAPTRARVSSVAVTEGQQVLRGDLLAEVEPYHAGDAG